MMRGIAFLSVLWLAGCAGLSEESLQMTPATFGDVPGWREECPVSALAAFSASCAKRPKTSGVADMDAWEAACSSLPADVDCDGARTFFETRFSVQAMSTGAGDTGLLTGYYEPSLKGSRVQGPEYSVPLYAVPGDMVSVNLGDFSPDLAGRKLTGLISGGCLKPYPDRAGIVSGALEKTGQPLVYVDDPADAFFLQVQGSGRVALAEGGELRLGYAGQNGHKYVAIGRTLLDRGDLKPGQVSMQSIKDWLRAHPEAADTVMNSNPSYVFFRVLEGDAVGAQNVPLTPLRSLAVDRRHVPLGLPLFIEAEDPVVPGGHIRRLMVAQDTGGAIKGPLRGDFFWGAGPQAEVRAGTMKSRTRFWMLLPKGRHE
ncbi:MAG: hypothetical protein A2018_00235 [Alphaproteobacteria bacterium GWF2_58_20]|nr:MAG: hypothetical protein A2018_00235 [Alphaproteobacteria bacterium GWF2_58_20]